MLYSVPMCFVLEDSHDMLLVIYEELEFFRGENSPEHSPAEREGYLCDCSDITVRCNFPGVVHAEPVT